MRNLQAVFWDFDGVVLDSVNVKTSAFARMFRKYGPEIEKAVVDYHITNGGISRFDKFKYYYDNLLNQNITIEELNTLGNEFSELVLEEVISAPYIAGALETLNDLLKLGIPAYVVSGTPEDEVRYIVRMKKLSCFFSEVHGSPRTKTDILNDIIYRKNYITGNCLFLGDAMTDYIAAKNVGIPFVGVISAKEPSCFPNDTNVMSTISLFK